VARRRRRGLAVLALVAGALAVALTGGPAHTLARAVAQSDGAEEVTLQTDASVPARHVVMLGSTSGGQETWGIGEVGTEGNPSWSLVRYQRGSGWTLAEMKDKTAGGEETVSGFVPDESPLTGQVDPGGAGALLGTVSEEREEGESKNREVLLTHNPGAGDWTETKPVPKEGEEALLKAGETLFSASRAPLLATLDEADGQAGALVVPVNAETSGVAEEDVLHWDGERWTSEQIEIPGAREGFRVLAIAASEPGNAWLLGELPTGGVALFRRKVGGTTVWEPVAPAPGATPGERLSVDGEPFAVPGAGNPPTSKAQILTVTKEGVWLDGERPDAHALVTMFFRPSGEGQDSGEVKASWCAIPAGASSGTPHCTHEIPELPSGISRSFAWAGGGGYGRRVITGLPEGMMLRLNEREEFERVLGLGESAPQLGAAFSEPREGWLGSETLPVHVTKEAPLQSELQPYPVPFRHALLAVAPQPGAPVGALSSQALAVGDNGEVARYLPGEGWQPESLLGPGGRPATPRLRAVAWPTPGRAYAVGELGQMWLWRAETGLWEPDPAAPRNFRNDLLAIAFDPADPSVGYAVGQQGTVLRYGKSWTQEALPAEVQGASFTSIAFAGSEVIIAYKVPHLQSGGKGFEYTGGLLVNDGSGWRVEQVSAPTLTGSGGKEVQPWAVAGLPDGGAALSGEQSEGPAVVMERNGAGDSWQSTATPYPGSAPGSLALFREGGQLRVIGSGATPNTREIDEVVPAPAGFPETLIKPYPAATGYVLRQTATGWSDPEHDRNEAGPPPGDYTHFDVPFQPDPTAAVLVNSEGTEGWAVGGAIESREENLDGRLDTADVDRYPAEPAVSPPGEGTVSISEYVEGAQPTAISTSKDAVFALGGDARCAAPCAERARTQIGPDVWLESALQTAGKVAGVRAFFDLGPRLTDGETGNLHINVPIPYELEYERYRQLLLGSPVPAFPVASPTDLAGDSGECFLEKGFHVPEFPKPLGEGDAPAGFTPERGSSESCSGQHYYAYDSEGSGTETTVRVIVLDEAGGVGVAQLTWLKEELESAKGKEPAIVLGYANLNAGIAANEPSAIAVAKVLDEDDASAYFFDSPERNVELKLPGEVPAFGTGTLGYLNAQSAARQEFTGYPGFLIAEVQTAMGEEKAGRWPVRAQLIPNVGQLGLEAKGGVLLRRSEVASFAALARRPAAGCVSESAVRRCESTPYIPIPENCVGAACATGLEPEYTFSSSNKEIGEFVKPNLASAEQNAILLENEKPIPDPKSGLFCAYNPGTTVVTITAGGRSASLSVTVQAGSARRPCGTVPVNKPPVQQQAAVPAPPLAPAPTPAPAPASSPPPVVLPPPPAPAPPPTRAPQRPPAPPPPAAFIVPAALVPPPLAFVPLPVPTPARPTPPTGTSAVTSPVEVAEHEEEEEEATESVSNQAVAYRSTDYEPTPEYLLGLILLAAFAGVTIRRRPRRGTRGERIAPATVSTLGGQRRRSRSRGSVNRW
jgi:hypothetical protein